MTSVRTSVNPPLMALSGGFTPIESSSASARGGSLGQLRLGVSKTGHVRRRLASARLNSQVTHMGNIENIERQIEALSAEELAQFRAWFVEFDWAAWDRQLEADIQGGKLDRFVEEARREHAKGKTTPL